MNKASASATSSGLSIAGLLGVAFVVLKLLKVIDWSWWWVTAPFWGGVAIILGILIVIAIVCAIYGIISAISGYVKSK